MRTALPAKGILATTLYKRDKPVQEHVAELAKANRTLREINTKIANETNYTATLSVVLSENVALMQAVDAAAFRYEPDTACLRIVGAVIKGNPVATVPDHPFGNPSHPCFVADLPLWGRLKPGDVHISLLRDHPSDGMVPPQMEKWHQKRKHTLCLRSALAVGEDPVGWLGVSFNREVNPDQSLVEAFRTLSQQVTLVLQLARLSELAKESAAEIAVVNERTRIAREMHDTLAQSFTTILVQLEAAKEFISTRPEVASDCLVRATIVAKDGLRQSRQTVMALQETRPEALTKTLPDMIAEYSQSKEKEYIFLLQGTPRIVPAEIDLQMFRIGQEAFRNALRYANAMKIEISLIFTPTSVVLVVKDDGIGFVSDEVGDIGFGLSGMNKRAERIGASLVIESKRGRGTRVCLEWRSSRAGGY